MKTIHLHSPIDMHLHVREGSMLQHVVPYTANCFSAALIMPNTSIPVTTLEQLLNYKKTILNASGDSCFSPLMTLYFSTNYTREQLEKWKDQVTAIKLYVKGTTTNSSHGVDPEDPNVEKILGYMNEMKMILCVHGETNDYVMKREKKFLKIYSRWAKKFPDLRIIMEHITTRHTANLLAWHKNLFATVTVHHLLTTTDDLLGDLLNPHLFCKPVVKTPKDKEVLRNLVFNHNTEIAEKVMLGTDSAPHPVSKKECECGCAGVFTAPIALQVLTEEFEKYSTFDRMQYFVCRNAVKIYKLFNISHKIVTLGKEKYIVPEKYGDVVPFKAGKELSWSILSVNVNENKEHCHAQRDGDCSWGLCPQTKDKEPESSGRHCPLDNYSPDEL